MTSPFGALLRTHRREAGFQSAYAFYHKNGGCRIFPFTYAYYAKVENGKSLPRSRWLPVLFSSLRLQPPSDGYRELVLAYLRSSFGDDELFEEMAGPWLKSPGRTPVHAKAIRRLVGALSRSLSHAQHEAIISTPAAMWSFLCLSKSHEPMSPEDLSRVTGFGPGSLRAGLETLRRRGLAQREADGRYSSPLVDHFSWFPRHGEGHRERLVKLKALVQRHPAKGRELLSRFAIVRAEEAEMLDVARTLHGTMDAVQGCAVEQPGQKTGMYFVEARLKEIFRF